MRSAEDAIEPAEEPAERPARFLVCGLQQQGGQRGAEGERVEGGEDDRDGDRQRELLVEPAGDAGDENGGNEHRRQNQRDGDDRAGDFLHGLEGGVLGRHAFFDVAFDGFDDDDGVVHHQADGQHQAEQARAC